MSSLLGFRDLIKIMMFRYINTVISYIIVTVSIAISKHCCSSNTYVQFIERLTFSTALNPWLRA